MEEEANPTLERDMQALTRTPEFRRLKRHVYAAYKEGGSANHVAFWVAEYVQERLMEFDPEHGV